MPVALILEVAVAAPLMGLFDYLAPDGDKVELKPGLRVRVPFGRGTRVGLIVGLKATSDLPMGRLRRAHAVLDAEPLLPADVQRLLRWASVYY
ncbi:MAG: primosomal protein N', partial [Gammaproteobacteria bacterium]|nr:primosomal protein N' [Gammaproteobacteria bacterium]